MNQEQLEAEVRRSLARHAATIDAGPGWPPEEEVLAPHRAGRGVVWWPIAAAVVAVLAVIGVVLTIRHVASDRHRPATPVTVTRTACTTVLPQQWQRAIDAGTLPSQMILGGAPDGAILVRRGVGTTQQTVLIAPDGSTRMVDERPELGRGIVEFSLIDRKWIVLPISSAAINSQSVAELDVIDRATLHLTERIPLGAGNHVDGWALFSDHLYWTESGRVVDHDIPTRQTRTVVAGRAHGLLGSPTGVAWTDAQNVTHPLAGSRPDQVPGRPGTHRGLVSDETTYAWLSGSDIAWYSAATKQTVIVSGVAGRNAGVTLQGVAGPYILVSLDTDPYVGRIVDSRTGAVVLVDLVHLVHSGNGVFAADSLRTAILHVDRLPGLHC
jgi:hypothetical protein